jgi:hypothetical protein
MADLKDSAGFCAIAEPVVEALQKHLGRGVRAFAFFDTEEVKGIGLSPDIRTERRQDPQRHTLKLRFIWPETAWWDYANASDKAKADRAEAFGALVADRMEALEAWYEFQLASSSQRFPEPISVKFEVVGEGAIPGPDGDLV